MFVTIPVNGESKSHDVLEKYAVEDVYTKTGFQSYGEESELQDEPEKAEKPPNFLNLRPEFKALCDELELDERRDYFYRRVGVNVGSNPDCLACRNFFVVLTGACKPVLVRKARIKKVVAAETDSEGGEAQPLVVPTVAPINRPLEPSAGVVNEVSRVSILLSQMNAPPEMLKQVAHTFANVVIGTDDDVTRGFKPGPVPAKDLEAIEYFKVVAEYITSAFTDGNS